MTEDSQPSFRQRFSNWYEKPGISSSVLIAALVSLVVFAASPFANIPVLIGFVLVLVLSTLRYEGFRRLGFRSVANPGRLIILAVLVAAVLEFGSSVVLEPLVENFTGDKSDLSVFEALEGNLVNTAIMLAVGWIVGGFLEEMFFRGFLVQETGRLLGGKQAGYFIGVVLSSVAFGLSHYYQGPTGMIMTGFIGFVLGLIYIFNGRNLWLNILVHGFVDTIGFTLIYFGKYEALREILPI